MITPDQAYRIHRYTCIALSTIGGCLFFGGIYALIATLELLFNGAGM